MKNKKDYSSIFMLVLIGAFIILIFIKPEIVVTVFKRPLVTVDTLPINEPISVEECKENRGILIQPNQECPVNYISWGYGKIGENYLTCCIRDMCMQGQLEGLYETFYNEQSKRFEKKCICPSPTSFSVKRGCVVTYQ